jgi:SAM-dependent methyltransferase
VSLARSDRAMVFGSDAESYDRWRPSYPSEAVAWLIPERAAVVADVGAGTGKLTGSLLARGLRVEAVEPDHRMLDVLKRAHPRAQTHHAGADDLPLADASVDAVLAADAWHWFPFEAAVAETRRVLRPGGWLGLMWNVIAPIESREKELAGLDPGYRPKPDEEDTGPFPAEETETATFPWAWHSTPDAWCSYLRTKSVFVLMAEQEREERLHRAHALMTAACQASGSATAAVHHEVFCARWRPAMWGSP